MPNQFFHNNTKLADVISHNHSLLTVLELWGINLGFGDSTISEICTQYNIFPEIFLMICNTYSFKEYKPNLKELNIADILQIVDYLKASHKYYSSVMFPRLHENIHIMVQDYDNVNKKVINQFYDNYESEVLNHFNYEEDTVFPYIKALVGKTISSDEFNIGTFKSHHTSIEEKLHDLKNIILKYIPQQYSNSARFRVLNLIFQIEQNLILHAMVEDKVLIPLVAKLERNG